VIEYQLIRSTKRKTIGLEVKKGKITVRAPEYDKNSYIEKLLQQKKTWLEEKLLQQNNVENNNESISLLHGGVIWINGIKKALTISYGVKPVIENNAENFHLTMRSSVVQLSELKQDKRIKAQIETWLKESATQIISQKVEKYSQKLNLFPSHLKVRQYKARWGSCNNRGELNFNYLLMMTPDWVVDYVVVHELCHLAFLNHSKQFWQLVEFNFPRYKEAKHWLKEHQNQLRWPTT